MRPDAGQRIDKQVEVVVIQRAVHPAIALGDIGIKVVAAEHDVRVPASDRLSAATIPTLRRPGSVQRRPQDCRIGRSAGWQSACRTPARTRYLCRGCGLESWRCSRPAWTERRSTKSHAKGPVCRAVRAALDTSRWAMKKSGFANWNATTFTDGSASRSVISAPNSTIVAGTNMLIEDTVDVTVQTHRLEKSTLSCLIALRAAASNHDFCSAILRD